MPPDFPCVLLLTLCELVQASPRALLLLVLVRDTFTLSSTIGYFDYFIKKIITHLC